MNQRSDSLHKPTARSAVWGYIRKYTDREWLAQNRVLKPIAHRFLSPELWRFTRRNVPRGVALGLFAGFVIPVGQIFLALVLAFTVRANVPIASGVTLVTNPLTFPFWIWAANRVGHKVLSFAPDTGEAILQNDSVMSLGGLFQAAGISAVLWGPGDIGVAHRPDEFVEVADLETCLGMLARLGDHMSS